MSVYLRLSAGLVLGLTLLALGSCNQESLTGVPTTPDPDSFQLTAALLPVGVQLKWQSAPSADFQEYLVFRAEVGAADYLQLSALPDTLFTDTTAGGGKVYHFLVAAMATDGSELARSNVITTAVPESARFLVAGGADYSARSAVDISLEAAGCVGVLIWNGAAADSFSGQNFDCPDGQLQVTDWGLTPGEGARTVRARMRYEMPDPANPDQVFRASVDHRRDLVVDQSPPNILPELIGPAEGAVAHDYKVALTWTRGSDRLCPDLSYQVFLGTEPSPQAPIYAGASPGCHASQLVYGTTYFWRVVVSDEAGNEAMGQTWSFTADDDMILVEPGTFDMGTPYGALGRNLNETLHSVTLTRAILVSPHEVTEELWADVMSTGSSTSRRPKVNMSWDEAIQFCNTLSTIRGFEPVYTVFGAGQVSWDPAANGYRLLTEAEWEYACRAGTQTAFANGDITDVACADPVLDQIGRYCGNNEGRSSVVGSLPGNAWGLHDMHGNVWEWCWDYYLGDHPAAAVTDPVNGGYDLQDASTYRIIRGGNFFNRAENCRSAARTSSASTHFSYGIGFRFARTAG